jgi:hypothetical protein
MEQQAWPLPLESEDDDWAIDNEAVRRVQEHAQEGCLMCALEDWDDE